MKRVWLTFLVASLPSVAAAQARESTDAHLRADCRLATQVLTTGRPATHRAWALQVIDRCESTGPVALAQLWSSVTPIRANLEELEVPSVRVWDQRLFAALTAVARNGSEDEVKRVAALSVLSSYAAPNSMMSMTELLDPRPDSTRGISTTSVDHRRWTVGAQPLSETAAQDVSRLMQELVQSEPSSAVGIAAKRLLRYVLVQH